MSSESESDDDYVPGEPEKLSEEESANEETDLQYESEQVQKSNKRKIAEESNNKKKRKTRNTVTEIDTKEEEPIENLVVDPVEEKKKEDDLWAKFLDGTDTKPKSAPKESNIPTASKPINDIGKKTATKTDDNEAREKRIFEFAGETIVVENNVIKEKIKTASPTSGSTSDGPEPAPPRGRPGATRGGLSSVLGQLNKSNKLSTLEKSKLDWATYKKDEGLEEEIQSHNKGKNGYLDKRDFLDRADVRQYEIERDLRMGRRTKR